MILWLMWCVKVQLELLCKSFLFDTKNSHQYVYCIITQLMWRRGHLLPHSGLASPSLINSLQWFLLPDGLQFILSSVISYKAFCLYVATNSFLYRCLKACLVKTEPFKRLQTVSEDFQQQEKLNINCCFNRQFEVSVLSQVLHLQHNTNRAQSFINVKTHSMCDPGASSTEKI